MSLLSRLIHHRSSLASPEPWLIDFFGGGGVTKSGERVTPVTALEWVFDAVQVRSQTLAALPLKLFRVKANGDKVPAVGHPLYGLLHDQPHPDLTSYEARNMLNAHLDLRGNAYAQIVRNRGGRIIRLVPIHPDRVQVKRVANYNSEGLRPIYYEVTNEAFGGVARLTDFDILHLRGYTTDGVCGISPVRIKAETIGAAIAANTHASALFANGARPAGVLEHPAKLGDPGMENLRKSWQATHGGAQNSGKIAILEEGMKFHEVGLSNEDAQLLESRKYSRTEIAAMYRVPPHMLGDLERATFSNIEQQSIEFVVHCMLPIVKNWEQRLNVSLLSEDERTEYFFAFNLAGLLRGDMKSRYEAYRVGLGRAGEPGWLTQNDIRESEDMNRIPGGDKVFSGIESNAPKTTRAVISPILSYALGRALRKEAKALRTLWKKKAEGDELTRFYTDHRRYLLEVLDPVAQAARALDAKFDAEQVADEMIAHSRGEVDALADEAAAERTFARWETVRISETVERYLQPSSQPDHETEESE